MPAVTEQFVSEFLVKGFASFEQAMRGADAHMDQLDKTGERAGRSITERLGGALTGLTKNLQTVGTVALGAASAGFAALGGAAMGVGLMAWRGATDYDEAVSLIAKSTGATGQELHEFGDIARAVFRQVPADLQDTAVAVAELNTRLGISGDELQDAARVAMDFARVHDLDVQPAMAMSGRLMSALELEASELPLTFDKLTLAAQMSGIEVDRLGGLLIEAGPAFDMLGFDLDRSIALFASFEKYGARPEEVISSMTRALNTLVDEGFTDMQEGFEWYIDAIENATTEAEAFTLANELFGRQVGVKVAEDIMAGRFAVDEWAEAIAEAGGTLERTAVESMTLAERVQVMRNMITDSLEPIGRAMINLADNALGYLMPWFDRFSEEVLPKFTEAVGDIIFSLDLFFTGLAEGQPFLDAVGVLLEDVALALGFTDEQAGELRLRFDNLVETVQEIIEVVTEVIEPIMEWVAENVELQDVLIALGVAIATVVIPIIKGVVIALAPVIATFLLVVGVIALARKAWETNFLGIQNVTAKVWGFIRTFIPQAIQAVRGVIETVVGRIRAFWDTNGAAILSSAQQVWGTIRSTITTVINTVSGVVQSVIGSLRAWWTTNQADILATAEAVWGAIQSAVTTYINVVRTVVMAVAGAIQSFWQNNQETILRVARNTWESIRSSIETIITVIQSVILAVMAAIRGDWTAFGEHLRVAADAMWDNMLTIFRNAADSIETVVLDLVEAIKSFFRDTDWPAVGKAVIMGIVNGIAGAGGLIREAATNAAKSAYEAAKGFLGITSPSRLFEEIGLSIGEGLVAGIQASTEGVVDAVKAMLAVGSNLGGVGGFFGRIVTDRAKALSDDLEDIDEQLDGVTEGLAELRRIEESGGRLTFAQSRELRGLLLDQNRLMAERADLQEQYAEASERVADLEQQRRDLSYLEQQVKLLDLITEHELDAEAILDGMTLGLDASADEMIVAMTRAMQSIVEAANAELEIRSPSRVFRHIGEQVMEGLALGISDMVPAIRAQLRLIVPDISPASTVTTMNVINEISNAYQLTTQSMMREGGLRMEFEAMAAAGRMAM